MTPTNKTEFPSLGDDPPQRQLRSGRDSSGPVVPSHHRTVHPVQSDPAFNNVHRGHIAHREREAAHRQTLLDEEFVSLHQTDRETARWVIPDEEAHHRRNENRRRMHLPEEPPPQLHMNMSREHEWHQQRISALEPFCLNSRPPSVPAQEMSAEDRNREERRQRIAELSTRRKKNEKRRATAADAREQNDLDQRMAQQAAQARERADHERRMVQWNAQQIEDEMRREQVRKETEHHQRVLQDEMRRAQDREMEERSTHQRTKAVGGTR